MNVQTIITDISKEEAIERAIKKIPGKIHILISNAGIMRRGSLTESSTHDFEDIFNINVKGAWLIFKKSQEKLNNKATVLVISSVHAIEPTGNPALYAMSKAALGKMAECIHESYEYTIKVAFPGPVDTALAQYGVNGKELEEKKKKMINPDECAELLMKLLESKKRKLNYDSKKKRYGLA
jgi:short-subunit dehydrogenase